MKRLTALALCLLLAACSSPRDGHFTLHVLATTDVHGSWFDREYGSDAPRQSLFGVKYLVDSVRAAVGRENVVLLDAGDCLQGDNAAYYYNYVDTLSPHLFPRLADYMDYDAVAVGNHDIETGHPVYDRVARDLARLRIPFMGANAVRKDDNQPYFPSHKTLTRGGLKIAVLGYTNANIKGWLDEPLWRGMDFQPIRNIIQRDVDVLRTKTRPDVVVVVMHSACGNGDGTILESEALDALGSVRGVDLILCGHDHRPYVESRDSIALINAGSHSRFLGHGIIEVDFAKGKCTGKDIRTELIPVRADRVDTLMREAFRSEFEAVRNFTLTPVGVLNTQLRTRDAYAGMCPYLNLLHTIALTSSDAEVSFAAPLTYNGTVEAGVLQFDDLFTIYPFENQLYVLPMTGEEIRRYLEVSYGRWIQTASRPGDHLLRILPGDDPRNRQQGWSFVNRAYNFDSAGGLRYTVDVTRPEGERVRIESMADGMPFNPERTYKVAMTSYRACGGGNLLADCGIPDAEQRITARYPQIRDLIYQYLMANGSIDPEVIAAPEVIGGWRFVPEKIATPALRTDMALLFGKK